MVLPLVSLIFFLAGLAVTFFTALILIKGYKIIMLPENKNDKTEDHKNE